MADFTKTPDEEFFRFHEFLRADGEGVLADVETLSSAMVKVTKRDTSEDVSASMVSDVSPYGTPQTQVQYKVKAGEAGQEYFYKIQVVTSTGQKFEAFLECEVLNPVDAQS